MTRGILLFPPAWGGLILVGIVFVLLTDVFSLLLPGQLSLALADTGEDSEEHRNAKPSVNEVNHKTKTLVSEANISDSSLNLSRESVEDFDTPSVTQSKDYTVSRQAPSPPSAGEADSATVQYSLGVIEYNEGNVESAKVWFQRAYESLEGDKGARLATARKTQMFGSINKPPEATPAKVQFPEGYKVNVYYRDGWYIQPKDSSVGNALTPVLSRRERELVYSFLPGSTYKIRVEAENEQNKHERINMGVKVIAALVMVSWLMSR
jgi:hypothetical protein